MCVMTRDIPGNPRRSEVGYVLKRSADSQAIRTQEDLVEFLEFGESKDIKRFRKTPGGPEGYSVRHYVEFS